MQYLRTTIFATVNWYGTQINTKVNDACKESMQKMSAFQCFELLHICSPLLCVFTFVCHEDSVVCLQKCCCAKSRQYFIHVQKIKRDTLIMYSSRKPQGLVSGLGNLKPMSQWIPMHTITTLPHYITINTVSQ
jgi:hypothetical protein